MHLHLSIFRVLLLLGLSTTLIACSTQHEREPDAGLVMVPSVPSDDSDASVTQGPYPKCTLADAQKTLAGTWSRTDAQDVWSEEQAAQCKAKCGGQSNPNQCAQDNCERGFEYLACAFGWRYHCASQPESGCAEEYRIFGCCVLSSCAADDGECVSLSCGDHANRMDECAADRCTQSAREMCVR